MKILLAVLLLSSAMVASQPAANTSPYAFKDDRLGMSLVEFKQLHHDPGTWSYGSGGKKVWTSTLQCKDEGASVSTCYYNTTIAGVKASTNQTFLDGKLAVIGISFSATRDDFAAVSLGLSTKYGPPSSTVSADKSQAQIDPATRWENSASIIELQPHACMVGAPGAYGLVRDLAALLNGAYCGAGQSLNYSFSRALFVDKALAVVLPQRIAADAAGKQKKANGDL